ncbi:WD40-repeat-containing domain protein [Phlyctochytrium arcticum]|nr:WD40-repeat-containing domain protein [Phlyctochytrium arcticum]
MTVTTPRAAQIKETLFNESLFQIKREKENKLRLLERELQILDWHLDQGHGMKSTDCQDCSVDADSNLGRLKLKISTDIRERINDISNYYSKKCTSVRFEEWCPKAFAQDLGRFWQSMHFNPTAAVHYSGGMQPEAASIVSSLDFSKDDSFFATAGTSRKIRVYNFLHRPGEDWRGDLDMPWREEVNHGADEQDGSRIEIIKSMPFPRLQLNTRSKIGSLTWNPEYQNLLAASDYEGVVTLWDVEAGAATTIYEEHDSRVWSSDWCIPNPQLLCSGGDDAMVKLWSKNRPHSVAEIHCSANVCAVKFHPSNPYVLATASADHNVYVYDLRDLTQPTSAFLGHTKAVSYVRFPSTDTVLSASTDGTLRLWALDSHRYDPAPQFPPKMTETVSHSESLQTFRGHTNERNFVGLASDYLGNWFACGSETHDLYIYWKGSEHPVVKLPLASQIRGTKGRMSNRRFVSAVAWPRLSNETLLVANSDGDTLLLKLSNAMDDSPSAFEDS